MAEKQTRLDKVLHRRERIVEAAATCFALKGFHQTSMREVAAAAGVSLGNLYNHFDSKSDLILEMAKQEQSDDERLLGRLKDMKDPHKAISLGLRELFMSYQEPLIAHLAMEIMAEATRDEAIHISFERNRQTYTEAFAVLLRRLKVDVTSQDDQNNRYIAECILDLVEAAAIRQALEGKGDANTAFEKVLHVIQKLIA